MRSPSAPTRYALFASAWIRVAAVRLALWLLPARAVLRFAASRSPQTNGPRPATMPLPLLLWSVRAAARRVPRASCLTRALATQWLLAGRGVHSTLRLGAGRADAEFAAHAWLEIDGAVVVGGRGVEQYVPFPDVTPVLFPETRVRPTPHE